jgi:inositol transport system permease protein
LSTAKSWVERSAGRATATSLVVLLERNAIFIFLLALVTFFTVEHDRFLSTRNITNVLTGVSIFGVIAVGMTFVILTAGIDLSVGSVLAFCSMCAAVVIKGAANRFTVTDAAAFNGYAWLVALAICLSIGAAIGLLHGLIVTRLRVPAFIVTLGGLTVWRGLTLIIGNGGPISGFDASYRWWTNGVIFGVPIPVPVLVFVLVAVIGHIVLRHTRYGRRVYAVGGNIEAARLSGVQVGVILTGVYVISGALSGLAGFLLAARLNSAEAVAGTGYELRVIASVVIGGTSLFGGVGTITGTVIGALIIAVMLNGLVMMNVSSYIQDVVVGSIIVLAIIFDQFLKRRRSPGH